MSFVDWYLPCFRQWLITHPLLALLLSNHLFTNVCMEISSLPLPPYVVHLQSSSPLCCLQVFRGFFLWGGQFVKGAMLIYPRGGWGSTAWCLALTCLVCWMSPRQFWSQHPVMVVSALLFSQCNVMWRSFLWSGGSGCWCFDSPWCFISTISASQHLQHLSKVFDSTFAP
jgi:hypothetical protein